MTDIYLIAVPTYANAGDVELFDPTVAPSPPGPPSSPIGAMMMMKVGGGLG